MVVAGARGPIGTLGGFYAPPKHPPESLLALLGSEPGGPPLDGAALTVALDVVQAWVVLITVGFTLVLFVFLAFCVCARKDDGYDEYEMGHGITTVKVCHDGGENGLSSYPRLNGAHTPKGSDQVSEASSRCTLKRELPAIPLSAQPDPVNECNVERTQSQHSSDLYAAVGDVTDGGSGFAKVIGGVQVLPSGAIGPGGRAAIVRDPMATSPTDTTDAAGPTGAAAHPYAKVKKSHPYAHVKLPKNEHPYARVVRDDSEDPETDTDNYDDPKTIAKDKASWETETPYEAAPPVPEKRFDLEEEVATMAAPEVGLMTTSATSATSALGPSSPHSPHLSARASMAGSAHSPTSPHSERPGSADIPAAMAISGRTPANEELPYMTPPLHHAGIDMSSQQNLSGDSQDSRGYTSISVREPLAALKAQTPTAPATQPPEGEGYYMTVSDDDADDMYACIYEGTRGVGSETYAQIEPRTSPPPPPPSMPSPPHAPSTPSPLSARGGSQPPPAPPSVDSLRHVVHSRQASSSSAASTVMGSPGVEKRGTRSPLPPLPQGDTSLYSASSPQPPHSPPRVTPPAPVERPTQRALEEMYAKVMKKQRPGHTRGDSSGGGESDAGSVSSSRRGSVDVGGARWGSHASSPPTTPRQSVDLGSMTHSLIETRSQEVVTNISRAKSYETAGNWTTPVQQPPSPGNPNYETIPQLPPNFYSGSSDHGYETVKNTEPAYASVERPEENYPGYETVKQTSDIDSEPGYETLKHREYETVPGEEKQAVSEPGYETVAHEGNQEDEEPGYETVAHLHTKDEAAYEMVEGKVASEPSDPGYEELKGTVHHARTTSEHDPNYEQLKFSSRRSSDGDTEPGYEVVKKVEAESTYEMVSDYDTQENYPTYEKIDKPETPETTTDAPMYASVIKKGSPEKKKKTTEEGTLGIDISADEGPSPVGPRPADYDIMKDGDSDDDDIPPPIMKRQPTPPHIKTPSPPMKKSPSPPLRKTPSPPLKKSPSQSSGGRSPPLVKSPDRHSPPQVPSPALAAELPVFSEPTSIPEPPKGPEPLVKSPDRKTVEDLLAEAQPIAPIGVDTHFTGSLLDTVAAMSESLDQALTEHLESRDAELAGAESPVLVRSPDKKTVMFDDSPDKTFSPSEDSSDDERSPAKLPQPLAQHKEGSPVGDVAAQVENSVVDMNQYSTKTESSLESQSGSAVLEVDGVLEGSVASDITDLPKPMDGATLDDVQLIPHDSFGALDAGILDLPQIQPQETVNPMYVGECSSLMHDLSMDQAPLSMSAIDTNLPPPPADIGMEFPNDLPPPVTDDENFVGVNNAVVEEPPPPLVPPAEVEGLDDLLALGHMGSSSSGSMAGQQGSMAGSSEKDSDSPQESDETHTEGTVMADDLPPPPPAAMVEGQDSDEELDNSVSSGYEHGFTAGGITVTVNPMADFEETQDVNDPLPPPPPPCEPTPVAPPSPIAVPGVVTSSGGSQSSSSGSGSQDTGSGSIESVVTVESAGDVRTHEHRADANTCPDPNDQITQV